jgi:hypothetical protein
MDTWNFSFLLLVSFLAISIIGVAMLPLDRRRPEPPSPAGGTSDADRPEPGAFARRLELASLYLQDLEARDWEKLTVRLAAPTALPANGIPGIGEADLPDKTFRRSDLPRFSGR